MNNVLKVDFWDIDEMANQITAVVQNDPLRDTLLENAQKEYQHLSWDNASEKIHGLYNQHMMGASA
jgi:glycosyltransferase involved in cell wall biosynthesis